MFSVYLQFQEVEKQVGFMNILCIMTTLGYSGAPKMMAWLANSLSRCGHEVSLLTFYKDADHQKLSGSVKRITLDIDRHASTKVGKLWKLGLTELKLLRATSRVKPDIVIAFSNLPSGLFLALKWLHGHKVIISERSDPYLETTTAMNWIRNQYTKADGVVFQTAGAKKYFDNKSLVHTVVIPNPVTVPPLTHCQLNERTNEIVFVGRFNIRQKRQDLFLRAFANASSSMPLATIGFFGDGEDIEVVRKLVAELGLTPKVRFYGQVDSIHERIFNARYFVLSSDFEGIPNALIDAMICGLPVIATNCSPGGAAILIHDRINGLLVPRGDEDALANAMLYMYLHPEEAEQMGIEAQKIALTFSPESIEEKWETFLKAIIRNE